MPNWDLRRTTTTLETKLLPSILRTVSPLEMSMVLVKLYICMDRDDTFWRERVKSLKIPNWMSIHVHDYHKKLHNAIPFNAIMQQAYADGADYMVRVNDDSEFATKCWIQLATNALLSYKPPNVGVVGPHCPQGNTKILTHDMVHRRHMEIFETYYPTVFKNWVRSPARLLEAAPAAHGCRPRSTLTPCHSPVRSPSPLLSLSIWTTGSPSCMGSA